MLSLQRVLEKNWKIAEYAEGYKQLYLKDQTEFVEFCVSDSTETRIRKVAFIAFTLLLQSFAFIGSFLEHVYDYSLSKLY